MPAMPRGGARPRRSCAHLLLRGLPWLTAIALHLALLTLWSGPNRPAPRSHPMPAAGVIQLQLLPVVPMAPARPAASRGASGPGRSLQRRAATAPATPATDPIAGALDQPAAPPLTAPQAEPTASVGSDGPPAPSLLDAPATRQAIRAVAGANFVRALSDAAVEARRPLSSEERLGQDIARAARGDCVKGEYVGGGAGLLSLPFWLAAEASGKCRR